MLLIVSTLLIAQTGCGESLMLEDATETVTDSSAADSSAESKPEKKEQTSAGAAAIMGQLKDTSEEETENDKDDGSKYLENFVASTNTDVIDLVPYELKNIDPDRDENTDSIQLRINEDSKDHSIASIRFWIDGTISDFVCGEDDYDIFRGAYACDFNFTDDVSNIVTVFTSSRNGQHLTTLYSFKDDSVTEIDSFGGFIDFLSIDGAGEFSITEATNIQTSKYGVMYVKKNFRTGETYDSSTEKYVQELVLDSNSVGYYPEEGHFAFGYPFSLKKELTLYVNSDEDYETGSLPINFRGVIKEMMLTDEELNPKVLLVEPEEGWSDSETNIDSPIYAPSSAGTDDFNPENYKGWISFTELSDTSNEGFYIEAQQ